MPALRFNIESFFELVPIVEAPLLQLYVYGEDPLLIFTLIFPVLFPLQSMAVIVGDDPENFGEGLSPITNV